jgi:internalin A
MWLSLGKNKLTAISPEIGKLTSLITLDLYNNQLMAVPPEIGKLTSLTMLDLRGNQLTTVPPEIGQLTQLQILNLFNNQLTAMPLEIGQLTSLMELDLRENPALSIPPEVVQQTNNPALILQTYFAARRPLHEAKLLLVGQGRVGKTSLLRRLMGETFNANEATTHGINVQPRSLLLPDGQTDVRLNIWDFGGQEIMHNTHQFFLTQRSLYLILLNAREDIHANRLHYWLKLIGNIADAPILIIANQIDQNPAFTLDERELRYHYPNIVAPAAHQNHRLAHGGGCKKSIRMGFTASGRS